MKEYAKKSKEYEEKQKYFDKTEESLFISGWNPGKTKGLYYSTSSAKVF